VTTAKKRPSGTLCTAAAHTTTGPAKEGLTDDFYIDSGASDHLLLSKGNLHAYIEFEQPVEIAATIRGKICAFDTGHLRVAPAKWEVDLEGQGWDICLEDGGMKLRGREGGEFAIIRKTSIR